MFSARSGKQDEDDWALDGNELRNTLNVNRNLTETHIDKIDVKTQLEQEVQNQETKDSGWRFDKTNSRTIYLYKTTELNALIWVRFLLRSSAILNNASDDKFCFFCSIIVRLHPCENIHPNKVSNYRQNFNEIIIDGFDLSNGFKCNNIHKSEKLYTLSINLFE